MPDNRRSTSSHKQTKNESGQAKSEQAVREEQRSAKTAEIAYIDRQYYSGKMSREEHASRSRELFIEETNRLNATLSEAVQSAQSSPTPLTEMVDKALNPDAPEHKSTPAPAPSHTKNKG